MQKFNHRLERCSNFTPNLKLFSSKLHQMIFHRSNRERERENKAMISMHRTIRIFEHFYRKFLISDNHV